MKLNLVIVGLNYEYNLDISNSIADNTNLFFLDVNEYINYNIMSRQNMKDVCGIEYLEKQENGVVKGCAEFENSVICMPSLYFLRNNQYKNFKNSEIVYVRFSKLSLEKYNSLKKEECSTLPVDIISFEDKDIELKNISNIVVNVSNKKKETVVKEILTKIGGLNEF